LKNNRILFILKKRHVYGSDGYTHEFPSGLLNSARFVSDMLNDIGFVSKVVDVTDNNDIDREVFNFKPDVVIIEALWVVPSKFEVLKKLHPNVKWVVRIHSEVPFLAQEGVAVDWLKQYAQIPDVFVATNSTRGLKDLISIVGGANKVLLLPNFYPKVSILHTLSTNGHVNVACFGAVRPFKNQLIQAIAAIRYGDETGKKILFHINFTRPEGGGGNVLKNLRSLFANSRHELVEHTWMTHDEFIKVLATMDLSMAVSLSETFCIVAADSAAIGVPIVVSDQVPWSIITSQASTTNSDDIVSKIKTAIGWKASILNFKNRRSLNKYSDNSRRVWLKELQRLK
jgi:hypothetical protein